MPTAAAKTVHLYPAGITSAGVLVPAGQIAALEAAIAAGSWYVLSGTNDHWDMSKIVRSHHHRLTGSLSLGNADSDPQPEEGSGYTITL